MPAPRAARACGRCRRGWSPECARSLGELALRTVGGYAPARLSRSPPPTGFIEPCLPTPAAEVPGGPRWVHEIKHDGYRFIGRRESERVRVFNRHGRDWSDRVPLIVEALRTLPVGSVTLDGEGVVCDAKGLTDFDRLRTALSRRGSRSNSTARTCGLGAGMSAAGRWPGCCARPATASGYPSTSMAATARPSSGMPAQWGWKASSPSAAIGLTGPVGALTRAGRHAGLGTLMPRDGSLLRWPEPN